MILQEGESSVLPQQSNIKNDFPNSSHCELQHSAVQHRQQTGNLLGRDSSSPHLLDRTPHLNTPSACTNNRPRTTGSQQPSGPFTRSAARKEREKKMTATTTWADQKVNLPTNTPPRANPIATRSLTNPREQPGSNLIGQVSAWCVHLSYHLHPHRPHLFLLEKESTFKPESHKSRAS